MPPRTSQCRRKREFVEIRFASLALLHQHPKATPTTLGVLNKSFAKRTILGESGNQGNIAKRLTMTRSSQTAANLVDGKPKEKKKRNISCVKNSCFMVSTFLSSTQRD